MRRQSARPQCRAARCRAFAVKGRAVGTALLVAAVSMSAVGVVWAKHESRKRFVQLQNLQEQQAQMDVEFGQLQLEQSTWATHGRIERLARQKLDMHIPSPEEVVIAQP